MSSRFTIVKSELLLLLLSGVYLDRERKGVKKWGVFNLKHSPLFPFSLLLIYLYKNFYKC